MSVPSGRAALVAGLALIAATNAVVLAGAAYNRSGTPEAELALSERELHLPGSWGFEGENTGVSLALQWRVHPGITGGSFQDFGGPGYGWQIAWLDERKLTELGFNFSDDEFDARQRPRKALLVLELDGAAYRAAVERAEARALEKADEFVQRQLANERQTYSRLFVIDAGLDAERLRATYPDRSKYAIVEGKVALGYRGSGETRKITGYVAGVSIDRIHVPVEFHPAVRQGERFTGDVAFGRRLEPYLVSVTSR